jgi:hypothetical protein
MDATNPLLPSPPERERGRVPLLPTIVATKESLPQLGDAAVLVPDNMTRFAQDVVGFPTVSVYDYERGVEGRYGEVHGEDLVRSG